MHFSFNIRLFVLIVAGIFLGIAVYLVEYTIGLVLIGPGVFWILSALFFYRRNKKAHSKFLPFPLVVGVLFTLISLPFIYYEWNSKIFRKDLRMVYLSRDLHTLNKKFHGGIEELSKSILDSIKLKMEDKEEALKYHVFTRTNETNLLVLIKIPELEKYDGETREYLMQYVVNYVRQNTKFSNFSLYVGLHGDFLVGSILTPEKEELEYNFQINMDLYPFYSNSPIYKELFKRK